MAKVDKKKAHEDLLAAMIRPSRHDVILRSAADALAELDYEPARKKLLQILDEPSTPSRRTAVLSALAKFGGGDLAATEAITAQLSAKITAICNGGWRSLKNRKALSLGEIRQF